MIGGLTPVSTIKGSNRNRVRRTSGTPWVRRPSAGSFIGPAGRYFGPWLAIAAVVAGGTAMAAPPAVFEPRALTPEPGQTRPFHAVRIPPWVEDMTLLTYCFSVSGPAQRDAATAAGSQMSEMGFVSPFYAYYDSAFVKRRDPSVPDGTLQKEISDYKRRHVRILAVVPPGLQGEIYEEHPDWRRIYTDTTVIPQVDTKKDPVGGPLCLLGPWGDRLIDILAEVLTKYPDVDAFSFDGLHHSGSCYCAHCRANYRAETGLEIPFVNLNDVAYRRYMLWRDHRLEGLLEHMQARLKAIKPTVALVSWTTNAGRFGHFMDIPRNMSDRTNLLLDAPDQEFWMDETNRGNTLVPAFANAVIWAKSNHRVAFSSPYLFSHGNPYGADSFPPQEVERRALLALTYGARPSLALAQPAPLQRAIHQTMRAIAARAPWMTHIEPEPWAAMLLSDTTRVFYGREAGHMEERYLANVLGFFRTSVEEHLPVTVISDWNLNREDLSRYKALILPNSACLSAAQCVAIAEFVRRGGGLVASLDTSLFDEMGEPRKDFALSDVFGAHYRGVPRTFGGKTEALDINFLKGVDASYWEKRKNIYTFRPGKSSLLANPRLKAYLGEGPVAFKGQAVAVGGLAPDAVAAGTIAAADSTGGTLPAIVTHPSGAGRVVYLPAGFDGSCYLYSYPYQRLLLADAIRSVAPVPPPAAVDAPMCVHMTCFRQRIAAVQRIIVHLYNDLNTTGGHARPDDDVPLREEVVPIHNIVVRLRDPHINRVHMEPGGVTLPMRRTFEGIAVIVPRLAVHAMIVAELAK